MDVGCNEVGLIYAIQELLNDVSDGSICTLKE